MNCPHGGHSVVVFTKKSDDLEIFIHGIFSNFTKILNHENLERYIYTVFIFMHTLIETFWSADLL